MPKRKSSAREPKPWVGVIMGSSSDLKFMQAAIDVLRELDVPHEAMVVSAHRTPDWMFEYASSAESTRTRGDHRGGGRRGASARHGRREDDASRARRADSRDDARRSRFPAVDRADAQGRAGRNAGHRRTGRDQRRVVGDVDRLEQLAPTCASGCAPGERSAPTTCSRIPTLPSR